MKSVKRFINNYIRDHANYCIIDYVCNDAIRSAEINVENLVEDLVDDSVWNSTLESMCNFTWNLKGAN